MGRWCVFEDACFSASVCHVLMTAMILFLRTSSSLQLFRRVIDSSLALSKSSTPGQDPPTIVASMKASAACNHERSVTQVNDRAERG